MSQDDSEKLTISSDDADAGAMPDIESTLAVLMPASEAVAEAMPEGANDPEVPAKRRFGGYESHSAMTSSRVQRWPDPDGPSKKEQDRFWSKVDKRGDDDCWLWKRAVHKIRGYGRFYSSFFAAETWAHAWSLRVHLKRPIKEGMIVRHTCDTPACVNPKHLLEGTNKENYQDWVDRGRQAGYLRRMRALAAIAAGETPEDLTPWPAPQPRKARKARSPRVPGAPGAPGAPKAKRQVKASA